MASDEWSEWMKFSALQFFIGYINRNKYMKRIEQQNCYHFFPNEWSIRRQNNTIKMFQIIPRNRLITLSPPFFFL